MVVGMSFLDESLCLDVRCLKEDLCLRFWVVQDKWDGRGWKEWRML